MKDGTMAQIVRLHAGDLTWIEARSASRYSREQIAESREQRAESREQRAESSDIVRLHVGNLTMDRGTVGVTVSLGPTILATFFLPCVCVI
jgi:hypothetical protein